MHWGPTREHHRLTRHVDVKDNITVWDVMLSCITRFIHVDVIDRSRLVGFSFIIIHDALSSHISVGFFRGWPNPFKSSRRYTTSWPAWLAATNSVSLLFRVTPPCRLACRDDLQEIAPSFQDIKYPVIDFRVSGSLPKSLFTLMEATPGHEQPQSRDSKQSSYPPFNTYWKIPPHALPERLFSAWSSLDLSFFSFE